MTGLEFRFFFFETTSTPKCRYNDVGVLVFEVYLFSNRTIVYLRGAHLNRGSMGCEPSEEKGEQHTQDRESYRSFITDRISWSMFGRVENDWLGRTISGSST
jgi:hypothetical protein